MSIVESLRGKAELERADIDRWRQEIADLKSRIAALEAKVERSELDAVEAVVAANILEAAGLNVERRDGVPFVSVEKVLGDPPAAKEQP